MGAPPVRLIYIWAFHCERHMCGIVGEYSRCGKVDTRSLRRMTQCLVHRGPDDEGYHVKDNVGLGFRRLSIIDLAGGGQPIFNEDRQLCIIFNGEIYNYRELKQKMHGHKFRTRTDTEVILHLFEEHGVAAFGMLNGMYALAIHDIPRNILYCARDRYGQKPFHYYNNPKTGFVFASEIRALRLHTDVSISLEESALPFYWYYNYIPAPRSVFRGIFKLPPQSYMVVDTEGIRINKYDLPGNGTYSTGMGLPESVEHSEHLVRRAVERHLIADVEVGIFLSGGLDSTLLLKYAAECNPAIKVFSATFGDHISEYPYMRQACERYGVHPSVIDIDPENIDFEHIIASYSEPFGDSANVPTYLISRFAARSVKSVITGEGGDEIFGGYNQYRDLLADDDLSEDCGANPGTAGRSHLGELKTRYLRKRAYCTMDHLRANYNADLSGLVAHIAELEFRSLEDVIIHEQRQRLPDNHFTKVDTASMAHSLEARCPFLDHELVNFADTLPVEFKVTRRDRKMIPKHILRKDLPSEFIGRRKWGFGAPVTQWMMEEPLRTFISEAFSQENGNLSRLVSSEHKARLTRPLQSGPAAPLGYEHWKMFVLLVWLRENGIRL